MSTGTVKWPNADKGFDFIGIDAHRPDVLMHPTAIQTDGFRELPESRRDGLGIVPGANVPQAEPVRPI